MCIAVRNLCAGEFVALSLSLSYQSEKEGFMWLDVDSEKALLTNMANGCMASSHFHHSRSAGSSLTLWRVERTCYTTVCILSYSRVTSYLDGMNKRVIRH